MKRLIVVIAVFAALLLAPAVFACQDCVYGVSCVTQNGGSRFCGFDPDGSCFGVGTCPQLSASLGAEYRVAAVHVVEAGKPLPQPKPQAKPAPLLTAAK